MLVQAELTMADLAAAHKGVRCGHPSSSLRPLSACAIPAGAPQNSASSRPHPPWTFPFQNAPSPYILSRGHPSPWSLPESVPAGASWHHRQEDRPSHQCRTSDSQSRGARASIPYASLSGVVLCVPGGVSLAWTGWSAVPVTAGCPPTPPTEANAADHGPLLPGCQVQAGVQAGLLRPHWL